MRQTLALLVPGWMWGAWAFAWYIVTTSILQAIRQGRQPLEMAGYINRFIDLGFPDLGGVDENNRAYVWVKIRNPKLLAGNEVLSNNTTVQFDSEGKPVSGQTDRSEVYTAMSKLIIAGNVWDPTYLGEDDPPVLPMPPTPDDVAKFPLVILNRIGEEMSKSNPR